MTTEQRSAVRERAYETMTGNLGPSRPINGVTTSYSDREQAWRRWLGAYGPAVKATLDAVEELGIA
jgi:hypothetical protein